MRDRARRDIWYPPARVHTPERMDDPRSDPILVARTLRHLELVNRTLSRVRTLLRRFVIQDLVSRGVPQASVLDVGAGGGDVGLWLVREGARRGVSIRVTCVDADARAVAYAKDRVGRNRAIDIVHGSLFDVEGQWDYVISNHVLHHLCDEEIVGLLEHAWRICRRRIVWNDLLRSRLSLLGFSAFSALLMRGSYARADGLVSILRGFRPRELRRLIRASSWRGRACVGTLLPGRVYIVGQTTGCDGARDGGEEPAYVQSARNSLAVSSSMR